MGVREYYVDRKGMDVLAMLRAAGFQPRREDIGPIERVLAGRMEPGPAVSAILRSEGARRAWPGGGMRVKLPPERIGAATGRCAGIRLAWLFGQELDATDGLAYLECGRILYQDAYRHPVKKGVALGILDEYMQSRYEGRAGDWESIRSNASGQAEPARRYAALHCSALLHMASKRDAFVPGNRLPMLELARREAAEYGCAVDFEAFPLDGMDAASWEEELLGRLLFVGTE